MNFTTEIKGAYINSANKYLCKYLDIDTETEIDDTSVNATVKWHVEIEARDWGIKGIMSIIDDVSINGEVEFYDVKDLECEDKIYKEFSCEGFAVIDEMEIDGDMLCPNDIEIDFEKKTITIKS